jgi:hypothetical protein
VLYLKRTRVTDAGLVYLKDLPELEELYLEGSRVTRAGFAYLKSALPNTQIFR